MNPFNVLLIESQYDEETGSEKSPIIHFDKRIFADSQKGAIKKAIIMSSISAEKIEEIDIYINDYKRISNYGEDK